MAPHLDPARAGAHRRLILIGDGLLLASAMVIAFGVHAFLRPYVSAMKGPPRTFDYTTLAVIVLPLWLWLISVLGLTEVNERGYRRGRLAFALLRLQLVGLVALSIVLFVTQIPINRTIVLVFLLTSYLLLYVERTALVWRRRATHASGATQRRILLVGAPSKMRGFVEATLAQNYPPVFVGYLRDGDPASHSLPPPPELHIELRGSVLQLESVLHDTAVDDVLFFPPHDDPEKVAEALRACEAVGVRASFAIDLRPRGEATPRVITLSGAPFLTFELAPKSDVALAVKHLMDIVGALAALVVATPILVVASLGILVTMGRPVLFVQERAGLNGRVFRLFKLRTMVRDAQLARDRVDAQNLHSGPVFKAQRDPRVTRFGRFLRKSSIDELPQLFNVLGGSMSLVGPRPLWIVEQQKIRGWHRRRLSMKPGITGLWQVSGRNDVDFGEWMTLDLRYVDEWSLGLDARILLRTLPTVLSGRGAH